MIAYKKCPTNGRTIIDGGGETKVVETWAKAKGRVVFDMRAAKRPESERELSNAQADGVPNKLVLNKNLAFLQENG